MIQGGKGGNSTQTGLVFEKKTDLIRLLKKQKGYTIKRLSGYKNSHIISYFGEEVARTFPKNDLYVFLKKEHNLFWENIVSKRLLPDDALYVIRDKSVYIIEKKFQSVGGSVDEKLQTCHFKIRQYTKIFSILKYKVEYIYLLSNYFTNPKYKDVLEYIKEVGCQYYFKFIPLEKLGLPVPK